MVSISRLLTLAFDFSKILLVFLLKKPNSVWIGDSHIFFLHFQGKAIKRWKLTPQGELIVWLGPRLGYSIATKGLNVDRFTRVLLRFCSAAPAYFTFWEIDCRVHLVSRIQKNGREFSQLVNSYFRSIENFAKNSNLGQITVLSPVPPSNIGVDNPDYPRNGTLGEWVKVTKKLTIEMSRQVPTTIFLVDTLSFLADNEGALKGSFTHDGVHLNAEGARIILEATNRRRILRAG